MSEKEHEHKEHDSEEHETHSHSGKEHSKKSRMSKLKNVCNISSRAQVALLIAVFLVGAIAGYALNMAEAEPTGLACAAYDSEGNCIDSIKPSLVDKQSSVGEVRDIVDNLMAIYAANAPILAGLEYAEPEYNGYGKWVALIPLPSDIGTEQTLEVTVDDSTLEIDAIVYLTSAELPMPEEPAPIEFEKKDKPVIELFVMSFCPYGQLAVEAMAPVEELLGDKAIFDTRYVIYDNYQGGSEDFCIEEGSLCSMHGVAELNENARQLCVAKYQPALLWDYMLAINSTCNYQDVDSCWEGIASGLGLDVAKIKQCEVEEKTALITAEYELCNDYGVGGSPTLIINGQEYEGARTPEAYKQAICSAFTEPPEECLEALSEDGGTATGSC